VAAVQVQEDHVLAATASEVVRIGLDGEVRDQHPVPGGVTALTALEDRIAVGFRDGSLEVLMDPEHRSADSIMTFEGTPSNPVTELAAGPMDTLLVGYQNGVVGLWNVRDGKRLFRTKMHGAIHQFTHQDDRVYVQTELGGQLSIDLRVFLLDYCELVHEVWRNVPITWKEGVTVLAPPPADHPCWLAAADQPPG
jgi:hypothetical protein